MASIVEGLLEGHAKTETNLAYLALDHVLAHNGELKRMHQDHHEIDDRLRKVHTANTCAEARRLLKTAIVATREHFRGEERSVFPLLERVLQEETLTELGQTWMQRQAAAAAALNPGSLAGARRSPLLRMDVVPVEPGARFLCLSRVADGDAGDRNHGRRQ